MATCNLELMEASEYHPYVCKLDEESQKKAQDELYEDPNNRQGAIDTLRDWVRQQKHINCPMDDVFLLGFLRAKHFSQLESREALERFMINREKFHYWMKGVDTGSEEFLNFIRDGGVLPLPKRDEQKRRVSIFERRVVSDKKSMNIACRFMAAAGYYNCFCDEMTQVHGSVSIIDWTGQTTAKELRLPVEMKKNALVLLQKTFPSRVKGIHQYNVGPMMDFLMSFLIPLLTDTMKERQHIHSNLESLYKHVNKELLPQEYLPDDYDGPNCGTVEEVKAQAIAHFQEPEVRERIKYLSSDRFFIRIKDKESDIPAASFRKLNVD